MRTAELLISAVFFAVGPLGCTVYTSAERQDGVLYVAGHHTYLGVMTVPFVRRCKEVADGGLVCRELRVSEGEVAIPAPPPPPRATPSGVPEPARSDCAALQGPARERCLARPPDADFEGWPD